MYAQLCYIGALYGDRNYFPPGDHDGKIALKSCRNDTIKKHFTS